MGLFLLVHKALRCKYILLDCKLIKKVVEGARVSEWESHLRVVQVFDGERCSKRFNWCSCFGDYCESRYYSMFLQPFQGDLTDPRRRKEEADRL